MAREKPRGKGRETPHRRPDPKANVAVRAVLAQGQTVQCNGRRLIFLPSHLVSRRCLLSRQVARSLRLLSWIRLYNDKERQMPDHAKLPETSEGAEYSLVYIPVSPATEVAATNY